ncbi:MAG: hypothetical protein KH452_13520 [Clostridiales bacterium]|nr:hypothetical protein [Clostridiales bacterium]
MKKFFIAAILAMCCVTAAVLGAGSVFSTIEDEGYAVPASAGVQKALAGDDGAPVSLVKVQYEDTVYETLSGYYVGKDRTKIDLTYPLYVNGGTGLRFLGEENWLVTPEVDLYQTFEGLYLSEGISYNVDMTQADEGEFILLTLSNGLYMNAQQAVLEGPLGSIVIPANSILSLSETAMHWYGQKDGSLAYGSEEALFDAVITIGRYRYNYVDLLDALGLIQKAIEEGEGSRPDPDLLQDAEEILNSKEGSNNKNPGTDQSVTEADTEAAEEVPEQQTGGADTGAGQGGAASAAGGSGDQGQTGQEGSQNGDSGSSGSDDGGSQEDTDQGDGSDGDSSGSSGGSGDGDEGDQDPKPGEGGSGDAEGGKPGDGTGGEGGSGADEDDDQDHEPGGGDPDDSTDGKPGEGSGGDGGSGDGGEGTGDSDPGEGDPEDGGESEPIPYQEPVVTVSGLQPWSYALGLDLEVEDPSGAIMRGVSFTAYKSLKGSGETSTNEEGFQTYSSESYEGKSVMLRKSRTGSQSFALSTLQPGEKVYLQYSYRYNAEETSEALDPATGELTQVTTIVRKYYYSDYIEIPMPTVEEGKVQAAGASWTTDFAAHPNALELDGLTLANTSAYDAEADYSFENFKLNTMPYVSRMELKLKPQDGGDEVTVIVGSSVLARAQQEESVFISTTPKLRSNMAYTYTAVAKDRWGNEIPLIANGSEAYSGTLYTRKATPVVTITEVENETDYLVLKVQVSDPDSALTDGQPLKLAVKDSRSGIAAALYGEWDTGKISPGGEDVYALELKDAKDGSEYELRLNSLAFSTLYSAEVTGDCEPQPDGRDLPGTLPKEENVKLGSLSVYTAALSSGLISFSTGVSDLLDTSASMEFIMTSATTLDMLPLVDEFRIELKDESGRVVNEVSLSQEELSAGEYEYIDSEAVLELDPGNHVRPRLVLYGTKDQIRNNNPWDSFCMAEVLPTEDPDTGEVTPGGFTRPMKLRVLMPENSLSHFTKYTFSIQAVVKKSGQEYFIPVSMTTNRFTTKKTLPEVQYSDLFLAADVAEFLDLKVYDPDGTILNDGEVSIHLYYGGSLLNVQKITADKTGKAEGVDLRFDGLIAGGEYTLKFVAAAYNDAEGYGSYQTNYVLESYNIVAGSALTGALTLDSLSAAADGTFEAKLDVDVSDLKGYLAREGEKAQVTMTLERSDSMELPEYVPYETMVFPLVKNADGTLSLDHTEALSSLSAGDGWRATLTAVYQGSEVLLDQITFRTDADYVTVSTHAELLEAQDKNRYANILVDSDFEQDQNRSVDFYGTIDFQGHTVTKGENITAYFLKPGRGSHIRNLVYQYPEQAYYVNPAPIFGNVYGTVDNLIVHTQGQVEISKWTAPLIAYTLNTDGALRNFILHLSGDVSVSCAENYVTGVLCYSTNGLVENGYVYSTGGAGLVFRDSPATMDLFGNIRYATVRHLYVVSDSWYQQGNSAALLNSYRHVSGKNLQDIYAVGDYYSVDPGASKNWLLPLTESRLIFGEAEASAYMNLWELTARTYTEEPKIQQGVVEKLYDTQWQSEILGEGFDAEGCVPMGFYPRLKLSPEMQKHQGYLPLPIAGQGTAPKPVSDGWGEGEIYGQHDLDSGYIRLRFKNDNNYLINSITLEGLLTEIVSQKTASDGFYDVILNVEVDPAAAKYSDAYTLTELTYTVGSVVRSDRPEYVTSGIEFWKAVASPQDWAAINDHMDWNYKLTADIDFAGSGLTPNEIVINGTRVDFTQTTSFTGKLDGQEHILKNITLENMTNPYVIFQANGSTITNLLVEGLHITASESVRNSYTGFLGRSENSTLDNVRLKGCTVGGGGYLGLLAGYVNRSTIMNCSAVESTLYDIDSGTPLRAGGLMGYATNDRVSGCYTRDVDIRITDTLIANCVGGLAGSIGSSGLENSYAHGTIHAAATYVGGINGQMTTGDSTNIWNSWSYVDILQTSGSYAGGMAGHSYGNAYIKNGLALGNVEGSGTSDRIAGTGTNGSRFSSSYAYAGQTVTGLKPEEPGFAADLLDGTELGRADTWQDVILLGSRWNYSPVSQGCAPILNADCAREGWQQEAVPLPGQSSDPSLTIDNAQHFDNQEYTYSLVALLEHPGLESSAVIEMYKNKELSITLDGMDLTEAAQDAGAARITLGAGGQEITNIQIDTKGFVKALDSYALTVKYTEPSGRERELTTVVKYLEEDGSPHIAYWEVPNLEKWNEVVSTHGTTGENIQITGLVDFDNRTTGYNKLSFNRLEGKGEDAGFANLAYNGGLPGDPWIERIAMSLSDLSFTNMRFDFTSATQTRNMTGAIISLGGGKKLKLQDIHIKNNQYTRNYLGFISNLSGVLEDVEMKSVQIEEQDRTTGNFKNYCGGLVAYSQNTVRNVTADTITIYSPRTSNVGGIVGNTGPYGASTFENIRANHVTIAGGSVVGGLAGYATPGSRSELHLEEGTVTGSSAVGGLIGTYGTGGGLSNGKNWSVKDVIVTATGGAAGGAAGNCWHSSVWGVVVEDCTVTGTGNVGGYSSQVTGVTLQLLNIEIIDTTVTSTGAETSPNSVATGGVLGMATSDSTFTLAGMAVRGCRIEGTANVGGAVGIISREASSGSIDRVYVAEDVEVTASKETAGGLIGTANWLKLTDSACGATVTAGQTEAGGIVGRAEIRSDAIQTVLERVYYKGSVSAGSDYAGGLIGKLNSGVHKFTDTEAKNLLVAADVRGGGENISLWINDTASTGDAGTGTIYICEDSLLNGQTAKAVIEAAAAAGKTVYVIPKRLDNKQLLVTAADFGTQKLYRETLGYGNSWSLDHIGTTDNHFMPYTLDYDKKEILGAVNTDSEDNPAGILLPEAAPLGQETVAYASGVNTVNIEAKVPEGAAEATVWVNGDSYTTDANGVVTLYYDFKTPLTIGEKSYGAGNLFRQVMTYGDYWYYIKDGSIHYGEAVGDSTEEMQEAGTVTGISGAVHLWQGYAMDGSGKVYQLNGGTAADAAGYETVTADKNLTKLPNARPFWTDKDTEVYYYFSQYAGQKIPYRVFLMDDTAYTVAPGQGVLYDGVVLSKNTSYGVTSRYFALLSEKEQSFTAYLSDMKFKSNDFSMSNSGIWHSSNNMGYNGTVLLAYYGPGIIEGVDYTTGEKICSTRTTTQSFFTYAFHSIAGLFPGGNDNDLLLSDGSYQQGEDQRGELTEDGVIRADPDGAEPEGGKGEGGSAVPDEPSGIPEGSAGISAEEGSAGVDGSANGTGGIVSGPGGAVTDGSAQSGGSVYSRNEGAPGSAGGSMGALESTESSLQEGTGTGGDRIADGEIPLEGELSSGAGMASEGDTASGESGLAAEHGSAWALAEGGGGAEAAGGTGSVSGQESAAGGMGSVSGQESTAGGTGNVSGQESIAGGNTTVPGGDGAEAADIAGGSSEAEGASWQTPEEAARELFGESVIAYSEVTGQYELLETASAVNGDPVKMADAIAAREEKTEEKTEDEDAEKKAQEEDSSFAVAWGINRSLYTGEKQGFLLISLAAGAGIIILFVIYWKVIRKRKH